jgi:hypothetical protein
MSCPHGNHYDGCDICDEVDAAYNSGVEHTKKALAAQRQWVGLTDEQAKQLLKNSDLLEMFENIGWYSAPLKAFNENGLELIRAIEAKLREKNGITAAPAAQPAPVQEPVAWHDKIMGMEVSMDVSTGDDDIDHRVYGQVYEVILAHEAGPDVILAIESERNFTTPPAAQPAVPDAIHHTDLSEHPQYIEGWNDCRAEMLKGMK